MAARGGTEWLLAQVLRATEVLGSGSRCSLRNSRRMVWLTRRLTSVVTEVSLSYMASLLLIFGKSPAEEITPAIESTDL